ncbi:MAG: YfhO family protein [Candidatus Omnitrophica bacterium]|nr:YfhO family protein [Candidatus Omnitrophota bacterium]
MKRGFSDAIFLAVLLLCIFAVFFDLATLDQAFLGGDHREQQFPWAKVYQDAIRSCRLPWWTTQIHCGFPLLAEGQIGAFYPLNFLFLFFLPLKFAYNYQILFQYFLGALFFFLYLRRREVSGWGAFFGSLIFLFGSAQGGYFYYNLISQKTVIWLPLTLILIDRLSERKSFADAFYLALVFAVQIFAGYLQVAIYSIFYSCLYFLYVWRSDPKPKTLALFTLAGLGGIFFSLVQLLATFELSLFSSRENAAAGLAYVGSMSPLGAVTLFYPAWDGLIGSEWYLGLLGLFFFLLSLFSRKARMEKFFVAAVVVFLLLALGRFSPLYTALVEITRFQGFRTPIKFLFFVSFSCSVLAAYGFDRFFFTRESEESSHRFAVGRAYRCFTAMGVAAAFLPSVLQAFLVWFKPQFLPWFQDFVVRTFHGKAGHPHSLDHYLSKAVVFYGNVESSVGLNDRHTFREWIVLIAAIAFVTWLIRNRRPHAIPKFACAVFLAADLFLYGFTSVKGNYENFDTIAPSEKAPAAVAFLKKDPQIFRVLDVYRRPEENRRFPLFPSTNMLYGIDHAGAYSPLVMRDYKAFLQGWGYVNDSISAGFSDLEKILNDLPLLGLINVKYLFSPDRIDHPGLEEVLEEGGVTLYRNKEIRSRAHFLAGMNRADTLTDLLKGQDVPVRFYGPTQAEISFTATEDGLLVLTDVFYPKWTVRVNGQEAEIEKAAGIFRAVRVPKGPCRVEFEYRPDLYRNLGWAALMVAAAVTFLLAARSARRRIRQAFLNPKTA